MPLHARVGVLAFAARVASLDLAALPVRPGADPVERLRVVARAVDCAPAYLAERLAILPELRAFIVFGEVSSG